MKSAASRAPLVVIALFFILNLVGLLLVAYDAFPWRTPELFFGLQPLLAVVLVIWTRPKAQAADRVLLVGLTVLGGTYIAFRFFGAPAQVVLLSAVPVMLALLAMNFVLRSSNGRAEEDPGST